MADVICIGCALVDVMINGVETENGQIRACFEDRFHYVNDMTLSLGGDALNEAIALGRLGVDVRLICGLGRDVAGALIADQAEKAGVDMSGAVWHPHTKTMLNTLLIQQDAEKYYFSEPVSDSARFALEADWFSGAKVVSLASLFSAPFDQADMVRKTLADAKAAGAVTCADVILTPLSTMSLAELSDCLTALDYFFPNEEEARTLSGKDTPEEMASALRGYGIQNVVIKLGSRGCYVQNKEISEYFPAFKGEMVDSTGAGDCFLAGFIAALSEGRELRECCRFAAATALLAVQSVGATTGVKNRASVLNVLDQQG